MDPFSAAGKCRSSIHWAGLRIALVTVMTVALGLVVTQSGGATPSGGPLSLHTCTVDNLAARCGTLMVPQDRITRTGPEIPIRVVVIPAPGPGRQPDPIVFFAGGPGSSAIDMMSEELPLFALNTSRDILLIEQRGTGASNLTCPSFPGLADEAALRTSVESCLQHLKADLRFYTTAMFADDVDEVLSDLHYGKVDLVGASYGATSEQMFLVRHPKRVRTMTLISGTLLDIPILERFPLNAQRALDNVFAECAREASCHRVFPRLGADWNALWTSVNKAPWVIPAKLSPTGKQEVFDADEVASSVHEVLMDATTQAELPLMIHMLGEATDRVAALVAIIKATPPSESVGAGGNQMMPIAVQCNEPWALDDPGQLVGRNSFEYHSDLENALWWQYVCKLVPKAERAAGSGLLTRSPVPVLAFNGEEDPQDPPGNMAGARAFWPNSLELAVPDQGHDTNPDLSGACVISLIESFLEQGSTAHLDTSCLAKVPAPPFALSLQALTNG
ncbi:MAG: alpha/beta hydrolase [Acidimicrobiales bacterium]